MFAIHLLRKEISDENNLVVCLLFHSVTKTYCQTFLILIYNLLTIY